MIQKVYAQADLVDDRHDDAVRMAIAAILSEQEAELIANHAPFGRALFTDGWSWDAVIKKFKGTGLEDRVIEYISTMHLTLEIAFAENSLCGSG